MLALSGVLIAINWGLYIWAVNAGHVVESTLGYFINPLLSVVLGVVVLKERLNRVQWLSVGIAAIGVLWLTFNYGSFPWIALVLALFVRRVRPGAQVAGRAAGARAGRGEPVAAAAGAGLPAVERGQRQGHLLPHADAASWGWACLACWCSAAC